MKLAALLVSALVAIVLAELSLGAMGFPLAAATCGAGARGQMFYQPDPSLGWIMRPGAEFPLAVEGRTLVYRADSRGHRSEHEVAPVVIAGDSFAWGWGVEYRDSVGGILGNVVNVAMPGYGLDQTWLAVRGALKAQPRVVVVIFHDDDLERTLAHYRPNEGFSKPRFELDGGHLVPASGCVSIADNSRTLTLARRVWYSFGRSYGIGEYWSLNAAILDAMQADIEAAGARAVFVRIPYLYGQPSVPLQRHMEGREYIDLYPDVSQDWSRFYFLEDRHFNEAGHRLMAERIAALIQ